MKKREQVKRKDNVIFLPGLDKRLLEKGLDSLQQKRFSQAISLFEEAREHDPENDEILIGLVMAYFEASSFKKAKDLANEMLLKGIGDYYQMVDLYLTILIQLHEYQEIVTTIEALLEEKEIPPDKHDHFLNILEFSRRAAENRHPEEQEEDEDPPSRLNLLSLSNINEQLLAVSKLSERNIRPYLGELQDYLISESGHPFLKTMILTLLKEQEVEKEVAVEKFSKLIQVIPTELPDVRCQAKQLEIESLLEEKLANTDPILYENIQSLLRRAFLISYPFDLEPEETSGWAAAFHFLALNYLGYGPDLSELAGEYDSDDEKIELALEQIIALEEISLPNI